MSVAGGYLLCSPHPPAPRLDHPSLYCYADGHGGSRIDATPDPYPAPPAAGHTLPLAQHRASAYVCPRRLQHLTPGRGALHLPRALLLAAPAAGAPGCRPYLPLLEIWAAHKE